MFVGKSVDGVDSIKMRYVYFKNMGKLIKRRSLFLWMEITGSNPKVKHRHRKEKKIGLSNVTFEVTAMNSAVDSPFSSCRLTIICQ